MFERARQFDKDISSWDISSVTDMTSMFSRADALSDLNKCAIHNAYKSNSNWPYDWSSGCWEPQTKAELQTAVDLWVSDNSSARSNYGEINTWDVSLITDMSELFKDKSTFNDNISNWDVDNVTNMGSLFSGTTKFNGDLSEWDVSNVTSFDSMFSSAKSFNNNSLANWDVSSVTNMRQMFYGASAFNGDISGWDVSSVTNMRVMFSQTAINQDLSNWDVSSVTSTVSYTHLRAHET